MGSRFLPVFVYQDRNPVAGVGIAFCTRRFITNLLVKFKLLRVNKVAKTSELFDQFAPAN